MEVTKQQALDVLKQIGDKLDGTPDGTFTVSDIVQRVSAEVGRVATLPDRIARHPVEYFWKGTLLGVLLGAGGVAPIAYGIFKAVMKGLGVAP